MKRFRRKFSKEFKLTVLRRIAAGESVNEVARALEMDPRDVRRWRRELSTHGERAFSGQGQKRPPPSREAELARGEEVDTEASTKGPSLWRTDFPLRFPQSKSLPTGNSSGCRSPRSGKVRSVNRLAGREGFSR